MPGPSLRLTAGVFLVAAASGTLVALLAGDRPVITPSAPKSRPAKTPAASTPDAVEEHWQVITIGDDRIGYARTRESTLPAADGQPDRLRIDTETHMAFKRFGQEIKLGVNLSTTETADGDLLAYDFEMTNQPAGSMRSVGRVTGDKLVVESTVAGRSDTATVPWDRSAKSPAYQERILRGKGLKPGESLTFKAFLPELNQTTDVRISAEDYRQVKMPDGESRRLLKTRITQAALQNLTTTAWLDDRGRLVLSEFDLLGQPVRSYEVSQAEAFQELAGAELDLAVNTLIPVTILDDPHNTKTVVYRIHAAGENVASLFASGDTQTVKPIDRETIEVTVTAKPVDRQAKAGKAADEFTRPSRLVQSNDARVREMASRAAGLDRTAGEVAVALEQHVHDKLTQKNFSTAFASAAEVAERLEGDCTEHAVLLAALLRARGIPSRVAVGLVYIPRQAKMGGHMWTEAYLDGGWVPLDATLGRGGIGGGHLKVADSSLADSAPLPITAFAPLLSLGPQTRIEILRIER